MNYKSNLPLKPPISSHNEYTWTKHQRHSSKYGKEVILIQNSLLCWMKTLESTCMWIWSKYLMSIKMVRKRRLRDSYLCRSVAKSFSKVNLNWNSTILIRIQTSYVLMKMSITLYSYREQEIVECKNLTIPISFTNSLNVTKP